MLLPAWLRRLSTHWNKNSPARSARLRRKHHSCQSILVFRYATAELLEDRTLLTTVIGASPESTGTLDLDTTSLDVTFSEAVIGADLSGNYSLVRAGADGILGSMDDVVISIDSASYNSGTDTTTLSFAALVEDIYRLTVQDTITDGSGNALDGDDDGIAGGDFTVDFVVGTMSTALTSPNGYSFDPESSGYGAGQLVEGTNGEFDSLNRLQVGGEDFTPLPIEGISAFEYQELVSSEPSENEQLLPPSPDVWIVPTGMNALTVQESGAYQVAGSLSLNSRSSLTSVVTARIMVNGQEVKRSVITIPDNYSGQYLELRVEDSLNMTAGDTVELQVSLRYGDVSLKNRYSLHRLELTKLEGISAFEYQELVSSEPSENEQLLPPSPDVWIVPTGMNALTVQESGAYQVAGSLSLNSRSSLTSVVTARIMVNGQEVKRSVITIPDNYSGQYLELRVEDSLNMTAGDTVELQVSLRYGDVSLKNRYSLHRLELTKLEGISNNEYFIDDTAQTLVTGMQTLSDLDVHREVTVPSAGGQDFARTVDVFHNATEAAITETVTIVGNLGSDGETVVFKTSDGDTIIEPTDLWIGTDDADGSGTPAIIHYIHGPQGLIPLTVELVGDNIVWTYEITVDPGETVRLAHFTILDESRADAEAAADALVASTGFTGEAASFLSSEELDSLLNFQFDSVPSAPPTVVYVNSSFSYPVPGQDPDGAGSPATEFGVDAFATIQEAIDAVDDGGIIYIAAGTYLGHIDATGKAVVLVPGNSPGQVIINGNLTLDSDDMLEMEINGTTVGSGFDQLIVDGTLNLNGAGLTLLDGFNPAGGEEFVLIENVGADSVSGTFNGLPEGFVFEDFLGVAGLNAYLTYTGGDGNDVVISVTSLETVALRVVENRTDTDANGESESLPTGQDWIAEWDSYWVELWVSTEDLNSLGIASVSLDLAYQTDLTSATSIEFGAAFSQNQSGSINDENGLVEGLSATTGLMDLGINAQLLFARIRFESLAGDEVLLDLDGERIGPHDLEFQIHNSQIGLGTERVSQDANVDHSTAAIWANPFDLNDDGQISFRDLLLFASVYNSVVMDSSSEYAWMSDFNRNGRVAFRDLILLVTNYNKSKLQQQEVIYPNNYPEAWDQQLQVSSSPGTPQSKTALTQNQAETALQSALDDVRPKLTEEGQQQLAQIQVEVVDLSGDTLGKVEANTIYLDVNAAGYGWFVDQTPRDHSEYYSDGQLSLIALPDSEAAGLIDLWTVIRHELGHLLGYEHQGDGMMEAVLDPGERKVPDWSEGNDDFFASLDDDTELLLF